MIHNRAKIAIVLLLAVGLGAGVVWHRAVGADPLQAEQAQAVKLLGKEKSPQASPGQAGTLESVEVAGQVLDPDDKPVHGAKLYLASHGPKGFQVVERATSGADGRFHFSADKSDLAGAAAGERARILASARGYGLDWAALDGTSPVKELTLRLVKDVTVSGRILDPDGKPVVAAKVTMVGVSAAKGEDLGDYLEAIRKGNAWQYKFAKSWPGPLPDHAAASTTGADGRFKLAGVGRERVVKLRLEGPAIASTELAVMTRAADKAGDLFGASFDFFAVASRPIRGVVRDRVTAKPLAGVSIGISVFIGDNFPARVPALARAVTDKDGGYELVGVAKSTRYEMHLKPHDGMYFQRSAELKDAPGLDALTADVEMVQGGVTVRGTVTDKATGKPIVGARVDYHPLYMNPNLARKMSGIWNPHSETTTGADGSYALTVFEGPGAIGVTAPKQEAYMPAWLTLKERKDFFKVALFQDNDVDYLTVAVGENLAGIGIAQVSYNALVLLEPSDKEEALVRNVALEAPRELKGRVVGPDGQPVTGVRVRGLLRWDEETLKGSEFAVRGINPKMRRELLFYHSEKNLGFYLKELRGDASETLTIKLQTCGSVSGRLVDSDGQPLVGERIAIRGAAMHGLGGYQEFKTDKEGRFRAEKLVPGQGYEVFRPRVPRGLAHVVIDPGKHKEVGDIKARDN